MREIGGYFELELKKEKEYYQDCIRLNSGRSCLRYFIRVLGIKMIWIPAYTCPIIWDVLETENCKYSFYDIDENMMPKIKFKQGDFVLYTNYFGISARQVRRMKETVKNLIIDDSQSFFSIRQGNMGFNSARKFFGVSDGAYLYISDEHKAMELEQDISWDRMPYLLKRRELGAREGYSDFQRNEEILDREGIKEMSSLTRSILSSIDYEQVKKSRIENYEFLHENLEKFNELKLEREQQIPMVYPFLCSREGLRERLISEGIFVATYWRGQKDGGFGKVLENRLCPLPIDQRYTRAEMEIIADTVKEFIKGK
ncbi:MAG: hypothetical protein Q4A19_05445 [Johnsonella sp.]|nr:hypothetical protein [Johnsonella sp.]